MNRYVVIIIWILACIVWENQRKIQSFDDANVQCFGRKEAFVIFLPVILIAGLRTSFIDTASYINAFQNMPNKMGNLYEYIIEIEKDKGFYLLSALFKIFISDNYRTWFLVIAIIQGIILVYLYWNYSTHYTLSIFMFIASADYMSWMLNGIRQFLAVAIIVAATHLMLERKDLRLLLMILFAGTIHQTALIMIPIVFLARGEAWGKKTNIYIIAVLGTILFAGKFTNFLSSNLYMTQYSNAVNDWTVNQYNGTSTFRVLVYCVPAILSFIERKQLKEQNSEELNLFTNMSIITAGLYIISSITSGIYIGRLPIYTSLYSYILLPREIDLIFSGKSRNFVYMGLIVLYLIYYYYQMHLTWTLI